MDKSLPLKKLPQLGLIGAGRWGKNLARNFYSLGALHTLCDKDEETLKSYESLYPNVILTPDFESILENPAIAQVAIATPISSHYELTKSALLHNKDVFVEKPLCVSFSQAEELLEISEKQQQILMVGHILHYHSATDAIRKMIENEEFGQIESITAHRITADSTSPIGSLWDLAPHDISLITSLFPYHDIIIERTEIVQNLTFGMHLYNATSTFPVTIEVGVSAEKKVQKLSIKGSKKSLIFDDTLPWENKLLVSESNNLGKPIKDRPVPTCTFMPLQNKEPLKRECEHFLSCCQTRQSPKSSAKEAQKVIYVLSEVEKNLSAPIKNAT